MVKRTDIINLLFEKFKFEKYLEIGVQNPSRNYDKICAKFKEGVDPNPVGGHCTYIMKSDDFFEKYLNKKYDVIFIDGFHSAEQVYKDIINSINHINENGFIVVHDCNPLHKREAITYKEYLKDRKGAWCGTVYKGFIKAKKELKNWSCFVINKDYGCGIITKRKILKNQIIDCDVNKISWDYFNENRKNLLQLTTFEDCKKLLTT